MAVVLILCLAVVGVANLATCSPTRRDFEDFLLEGRKRLVKNAESNAVAATCGVPAIPPNAQTRVVGGSEATKHSWPWMVSLQRNGDHYCGGAIINNQWVVSAAHCAGIFERPGGSVVLGLHSRSESDAAGVVRVNVAKVIVNHKYSTWGRPMTTDLMLLKLETPVEFTDFVSPVCLPKSFQKVSSGTRCYSTGWGALRQGGSSPDNLMQVVLPVIDLAVCNQPAWYDGQLDDTMVCAGYEEGGRDTCQGDSGGPFVCYDEDHWMLYGVVSWGEGCANANRPGLYGRVSPYVKWINKQISENSD